MRPPLPLQMGVDLPTLVQAASTETPLQAAYNQNTETDLVRSLDIEDREHVARQAVPAHDKQHFMLGFKLCTRLLPGVHESEK